MVRLNKGIGFGRKQKIGNATTPKEKKALQEKAKTFFKKNIDKNSKNAIKEKIKKSDVSKLKSIFNYAMREKDPVRYLLSKGVTGRILIAKGYPVKNIVMDFMKKAGMNYNDYVASLDSNQFNHNHSNIVQQFKFKENILKQTFEVFGGFEEAVKRFGGFEKTQKAFKMDILNLVEDTVGAYGLKKVVEVFGKDAIFNQYKDIRSLRLNLNNGYNSRKVVLKDFIDAFGLDTLLKKSGGIVGLSKAFGDWHQENVTTGHYDTHKILNYHGPFETIEMLGGLKKYIKAFGLTKAFKNIRASSNWIQDYDITALNYLAEKQGIKKTINDCGGFLKVNLIFGKGAIYSTFGLKKLIEIYGINKINIMYGTKPLVKELGLRYVSENLNKTILQLGGLKSTIKLVGLNNVVDVVGFEKTFKKLGLNYLIKENGIDKLLTDYDFNKISKVFGLEKTVNAFGGPNNLAKLGFSNKEISAIMSKIK